MRTKTAALCCLLCWFALTAWASADAARDAKQLALNHAGFTEQGVSMDTVRNVNGAYEVTFRAGSTEYRYRVDAENGEILSISTSSVKDSGAPRTGGGSGTTGAGTTDDGASDTPRHSNTDASDTPRGENTNTPRGDDTERVKRIALFHAGLPSLNLDALSARNTGGTVYDVDLDLGVARYKYRIDARDGEILSFSASDAQSETGGGIKLPSVTLPNITLPRVDTPEITLPDVEVPDITLPDVEIPDITLPDVELPRLPDSENTDPGERRAKEIALSHAGLTDPEVSAWDIRNTGGNIYEVNFETGRVRWRYRVDIADGEILSYSRK